KIRATTTDRQKANENTAITASTYASSATNAYQSPIGGLRNLRDALPKNVMRTAAPKQRRMEGLCPVGARMRVDTQRMPTSTTYIRMTILSGGNGIRQRFDA